MYPLIFPVSPEPSKERSIANLLAPAQPMSQEEFEFRLQNIKNSIQDKATRQWALNRLQNGNQKGQRRLLRELYDEIGPFAQRVFPDKKRFIERHVEMRNNVAHRNPETAEIEQSKLFFRMHGVIVLCHAAVMVKIGLSQEEVMERMLTSNFRWFLINKAASLYSR